MRAFEGVASLAPQATERVGDAAVVRAMAAD